MTLQKQMEATLQKLDIPAKDIHCYGSQIMITCWGRESAEKFHSVLHKFCRIVRPVYQGIEENVKNENTVLRPSTHKVWRVWGTV